MHGSSLVRYHPLTRPSGAVTLQYIANLCGVSRMTVSRVAGDRRYVSETTAVCIRDMPGTRL